MTKEQYRDEKERLAKIADIASNEQNKYRNQYKKENGLVSDECLMSDEYRRLKRNWDIAFANERNFNATIPKKIANEIAMDKRREKMTKK